MAIKPTPNNNMFKSLVFDGVDSRDYGIYITGDAVFNSPERDVEMIEIPGRNGAYAMDNGRFSNIKVSYPAGIAGDTEADFREGISAFRNVLASRKGYKRLEDDYNPDEYRMAVYKSGLEVTPKALKAGEFTITFDCKPQRFLKSGETAVTIGGDVTNTQTKSGSIVTIEGTGADKVTSLVAQIEPVQAGSGDPSPTNVRAITGHTAANVQVAGKNLLNLSALYNSNQWIYSDGRLHNASTDTKTVFTFYAQLFNGNTFVKNVFSKTIASGAFFSYVFNIGDSVGTKIVFKHNGRAHDLVICSWTGFKQNTDYCISFNAVSANPTVAGGLVLENVQIELGTAATEYEPYNGATYPISFGSAGTVYGGTVDVVAGVLTVTHKFYNYGSISTTSGSAVTGGWRCNFLCPSDDVNRGKWSVQTGGQPVLSMFNQKWMMNEGGVSKGYSANDYTVIVPNATSKAEADAALKNLQIVYKLATPQTYNLTAQQVELLTGNNNVWADTGDITITWGDDPNKLVNPTLYDSHPLLQVWGYGDIGINDDTINIADNVIGDMTLWERPSTQWDQKGGITYSQSNLRSGDRITVSKGSRALIELDFPQGDIVNHVSHTVTGGDVSKFSQIVDIRRESAAYIDVYYNALTFIASSNSSETATIEVTIEHTPSGGSATVSTVNCTFEITNRQVSAEQHKYKMWISGKPTGNYSSVISEYKYGYRIERMTAYSTKSALGEPLYFDLDIGEAYKIEDGQTISVNNAVSFPAQLPVLKSGTNTITLDDTVDQFKIVPRWWRV